jgi:CDK-activating kinase assembly factor MAT1
MRDFYNRALRDAFGGFGVFVEDEMTARHAPSLDASDGARQAVAVASGGKDVAMDDVF